MTKRIYNTDNVIKKVVVEYNEAADKFGSFASTHEGIAVLREEYLELEHEVFTNGSDDRLREEAIQVAAMAIRFANDLCKS